MDGPNDPLELLPVPEGIPVSVTGGYQAQNDLIFALQTGLDTVNPFDDGNTVSVPAGGLAETNGKIYKITTEYILTKEQSGTAYWIEVVPSDDGLTADLRLTDRPGKWNSAKQGCYKSNGRRTLNWVSLGSLSNPPSYGAEFSSGDIKGTCQIQLAKGWKYIDISSGAGQGDGQPGSGSNAGAGGKATVPVKKTPVFFHPGGCLEISVGANGKNGGNGGKGGGGGASGSGEASKITNISSGQTVVDTGSSPAGLPGAGAPSSGLNGGGGDGGTSGTAGHPGRDASGWTQSFGKGGDPGAAGTASSEAGNGSDGLPSHSSPQDGVLVGSGGGGGGGGGINGEKRPPGSDGGHCNIFALTG